MEREPFGLLVPAYVYPSVGNWDVLLAVGRKLQRGLLTVANPSSGPGDPPANQDYVKAIDALHNRCASVIGYVHDSYGTNATVFDDIDRWFSMYNVDGIFIDQASHTDLQRAATLVDHVRSEHTRRIVVLNPGTIPAQDFVEAADPALIVIQEQAAVAYEGDWPPAGWVRERAESNGPISADRLAVIAHTAPAESDLQAVIDVAERYRLGWVYVQDSPNSVYNIFSTWLPALGNRLQCAREKSPLRYFACKAVGGLPCMASQALARLVRK